MKTVFVRGADRVEREVALVRHTETTAYVCSIGRYRESMQSDDVECAVVGFPMSDVRFNDEEEAETVMKEVVSA